MHRFLVHRWAGMAGNQDLRSGNMPAAARELAASIAVDKYHPRHLRDVAAFVIHDGERDPRLLGRSAAFCSRLRTELAARGISGSAFFGENRWGEIETLANLDTVTRTYAVPQSPSSAIETARRLQEGRSSGEITPDAYREFVRGHRTSRDPAVRDATALFAAAIGFRNEMARR